MKSILSYKKYTTSKKNLTAARILECDLPSDTENSLNTEEEEIFTFLDKFDEQLYALEENFGNYSSENFKEALFFFQDFVNNENALSIIRIEMNEKFLDLLNLIINFLNQHVPQLSLNIPAIHILNNLISEYQSSDECEDQTSEKLYFPISEKFLIDLYGIFEYFISIFFNDLSPDYIPMIYECFQLMNIQFSLAHFYFNADINNMPTIYQEELKHTIKVITDIISVEDIDPQILKILFKSSSILYSIDCFVFKYFVKAGFVRICFELMESRNQAFIEIAKFLETISYNDKETIDSFPKNYPEIFRFLLEDRDTPDEYIESILNFISKLSISPDFTEKIISIDNFLNTLLSLDQSYKVRVASVKLFNSLTYNHFDVIHNFFTENPDFDIFIDFIDTGFDDVIQDTLPIISFICQKVASMPEIPDYFYNLAQSTELMNRIDILRDEEERPQTQEYACMIISEIKGTIESRNLDIEFGLRDFNYELEC